MDRTSLGLAPKSFALEMAQFYTDLYMRRAFIASVLPFKPDVILHLGDHFDGGPHLSDEEYGLFISFLRSYFTVFPSCFTTRIYAFHILGFCFVYWCYCCQGIVNKNNDFG